MVTLANRAKVATATTGAGTITLGAAESGYQSFADAGVSNSDVVRYVIEDGDAWEIGTGTYSATGPTLTRTVIESSNADAALNLTGNAVVFLTVSSGDIQQPPAEGAFVDGDKTKLDGIEAGATADQTAAEILAAIKTVDGAGSGLDADLLDGNSSAFFYPASNPNGYTTNVGDITGVTAGSGITGGGTSGTVTISHADTSTQTSVNNSGRTFIQDITLDTYGHVTGIVSATDADTFTGTVTSVATGGGLTGGTITTSGTISHADTSSQASVNNSNGTVIQDITLDTYGHLTGIASVDLDGRYYTESEADSRFVNASGDTMTGDLSFGSQTGTWISSSSMSDSIGWNTSYGVYIGSNTLGYNSYLRGNGTFSNNAGIHNLFHDGYHPNADKWTTARTLSLSGDATGSVSWDGSANATLSVAVVDDSHNHVISNVDGLQTALDGKLSTTGKAADSELLDGYNASQSQSNNTVAVRNASGYLFSNYFNGTGTFSTTGSTSGMARFTGTNGTDTYGRSYTAAAARTLLNVEDGATADQTASEILTAIKTVDGSGSGLDADLLDGINSGSFLRSDAADTFTSLSGTSVTLGAGAVLTESTGRTDLLKVTSSTSSYGGIQISNSSNEFLWSFMGDGATGGIYDDLSNAWHIQFVDGGETRLFHAGYERLNTLSEGVEITSGDLYVPNAIIHTGDTNTYTQFHAEDQWRVVTGGTERLEVNNTQITSTRPFVATRLESTGGELELNGYTIDAALGSTVFYSNATHNFIGTVTATSFSGDGSSLSGIAARAGGGGSDEIFWENGQNVTSNYTITNGKNAMSAGPITINSGVTVTVGAGETWTVV